MSSTQVSLKVQEAEGSSPDKRQELQTAVDLSQYIEPHHSSRTVLSFAIEEHQRNTADNPDRENTNTLPVLVRRVDSEELLPRPFKTTTQLIGVSYLSAICCLCFGVCAVHHAWEAKQKRNAGVLSSAVKDAQQSCRWMKLALGLGVCVWILGMVLLAVFFTSGLR